MGLLSELRRRNVVGIAAGYIVVSWGLIEVAETILPAFGFSDADTAVRIAVIVLAIGFVPAVVLAWVFEITPEGIKRDHEVDHDHPSARQRRRRVDRAVLVVLALAVTYFSVDKFLIDPVRDEVLVDAAELRGRVQAVLDSTAEVSIAVLPFRFEGNNPDFEILASGIPEAIINRLAGNDSVLVISWSDVRNFKGDDINTAEIAEQLDVSHLVEGTVRVIGDTVQIAARLIDAATNSVPWSHDPEPIRLSINTIFNAQGEIAATIVERLEIQMAPDDPSDPDDEGTDSWDAFVAYMKGREALADRTISQIDAAIDIFLEAIEMDPEYAKPYSGLHDACWLYTSYAEAFHPKCERPIRQYLHTALELDESLGDAWISFGYSLAPIVRGCDLPDETKIEALNAMRRGLFLSPASAHAFHWYAMFLNDRCTATNLDQFAANRIEFEKVLRKGLDIAPLYVTFHQLLAYHHSRMGDADKAFEIAHRMRKMFPGSYQSYLTLANLEYSTNGRVDRFVEHMLEAYALHPEKWDFLVDIADAYISLGDFETARQYLALAEDQRRPGTRVMWQFIHSVAMVTLFADGRNAAGIYLQEMLDPDDLYIWPVPLQWLQFNLEFAGGRIDSAGARLNELHANCDSPGKVCWPIRHMGTARIMQEQGDNEKARDLVRDTWEPFRREITRFETRRTTIQGIGIQRARILSLLGERDLALAELKAAVDEGWRGFYYKQPSFEDRFYPLFNWRFDAEYDVLLDGIRDDPRFRESFDTIDADMKDQLASIHEKERKGELKLPASFTRDMVKD